MLHLQSDTSRIGISVLRVAQSAPCAKFSSALCDLSSFSDKRKVLLVLHVLSRIRLVGIRPKAVPEEICNLRTFRFKWLEFLAQGSSFIVSPTHAYEPGLSGLMLGGKDRPC